MWNMQFLKVWICFALVIVNLLKTNAIEIPEHLKKQAKKLHSFCQKEKGVTDDEIRRILTEDFPADETLACYVHCLFDKVGLIDSSEVVHLENLVEVLPSDLHSTINRLVDLCGTKSGSTPCQTVYQTAKCYHGALPGFNEQVDFIFT